MNPIEKLTDAEVKRKCEEICNLNCSSKLWTDDFTGELLEKLREWECRVQLESNSQVMISKHVAGSSYEALNIDFAIFSLPKAFLLAAHALGHWKPKEEDEKYEHWLAPNGEVLSFQKTTAFNREGWKKVKVIPCEEGE